MKMNRTEINMLRWMCAVKLNERKKSEELRELLGLEPVSLMIKKSRLSDNNWVKFCTKREVEGIKTERTLEKDLVGLC